MKLSWRICFAVCALVAFGAVGVCVAEEPESVYVAKTKVITIRDKGTFNSTRERAIAIEKAICEVMSKQDTQHPKVTVKQSGGVWGVYCADIRVATVTKAEADANGVPEKSLAAMWAKNLRENLPKATPCSKMPASSFQPKPGEDTGTPPVTTPVKPKPKPEVTETPVAPVVPVAPVEPVTPVVAGPPVVAALGAPLLLVRDAFEIARSLPEEEYTAKRDEMANHLIADLTPFITGRVANAATVGPPVKPVTPVVEPTAVTPKPEPVTPKPVKPHVLLPAPKPAPDLTLPEEKPGATANEKVPQKARIREKLAKARDPYLALKKEDPQAAKPVDGLLAACRNAFALGNFDQSEQYVDSALALLGVK